MTKKPAPGPPPPAVHPRGPTGTPHAPLRQLWGKRFAARGAPLWTPPMNRFPSITGGQF